MLEFLKDCWITLIVLQSVEKEIKNSAQCRSTARLIFFVVTILMSVGLWRLQNWVGNDHPAVTITRAFLTTSNPYDPWSVFYGISNMLLVTGIRNRTLLNR